MLNIILKKQRGTNSYFFYYVRLICSCGTVALMVLGQFSDYLRTTFL